MSITVTWKGHASFIIQSDKITLYIDPWKIDQAAHNGDIILVSHSHYDHFSPEDIRKTIHPHGRLIAPQDVIKKYGSGQTLKGGEELVLPNITITAIPAYNINKDFHPRANNWVGYVIELEGKRLYYSGDTDATVEMTALPHLNLVMLPVGGTYTFDAKEAAAAINRLKPDLAIPYHWGDIVGKRRNADEFAELNECRTIILLPGESIQI